ncbi:MAG: SGNH/GDSL hydrolase family protein [bacterium]
MTIPTFIALTLMATALQAQTPAPVWELGKSPIDPKMTTGKVDVVNGTVMLDGANAFALPANLLGAQNDYTIEFEVQRPADTKQGHGLTFVSNTDDKNHAGLGFKYFPPEYNAMWLFCNGYQTVEQRGFLNNTFNKITLAVKDRRLSVFRNGLLLAVTDEVKPSSLPLTFGEIRTAQISPYPLRNIRIYDQAIFPTGFDQSAERMRHVSGDQYTMQRADIKNPSLPRILVIGDSISMGYRGFITEHFKGRAYVDYWVGSGCSWYGKALGDKDSTTVRSWKGVLSNGPYNVISWNAMTLHWWSPSQSNRCPESALALCATEAVEHLKQVAPKTKLIWVRCTPIRSNLVDGTPTLDNPNNALMVKFNAIVDKVMEKQGIPEVDLYAIAEKQLNTIKPGSQDSVHWNQDVSRLMATEIIKEIEKALQQK